MAMPRECVLLCQTLSHQTDCATLPFFDRRRPTDHFCKEDDGLSGLDEVMMRNLKEWPDFRALNSSIELHSSKHGFISETCVPRHSLLSFSSSNSAETGGMLLVAYAGPVRSAAALRVPTDRHSFIACQKIVLLIFLLHPRLL